MPVVNIGSAPNSRDGDRLRVAFGKINDAFGALPDFVLTPEQFGCVGDGVTDDGQGLIDLCQAINARGGRARVEFRPGAVYAFAPKTVGCLRNIGATVHQLSLNPFFFGVTGLALIGNGATLRCLDNTIPTDNGQAYSEGMSYGMLNFFGCRHVLIQGLTIDGNRDNQLHTLNQNTGANNGFSIDSRCSDFWILDNKTLNLGCLRTGIDKRGDGVYASNGVQNIYIRGNRFEDYGRWAVTLERPRAWAGPGREMTAAVNAWQSEVDQISAGTASYAESSLRTKRFFVENNEFLPKLIGSDYWALGSIDIETFILQQEQIYIKSNTGIGRCNIAFGGARDIAESFIIKDFYIEDNVFNFKDAYLSSRDALRFSGGNEPSETFRVFENFNFTGNTIISGYAGIRAQNSGFIDLNIVGNLVKPPLGIAVPSANDLAFTDFTECAFAGKATIANNVVTNASSLMTFNKWMAYSAPFDSMQFELEISGNRLGYSSSYPLYSSGDVSFPININFQQDVLSTYGIVAGSKVSITGNTSTLRARVNRPLDASSVFSATALSGAVVSYSDDNLLGLGYKPGCNLTAQRSEQIIFSLDGRALFANNATTTVASGGMRYFPRSLIDSGRYRFVSKPATSATTGSGSGDYGRIYVCELIGEAIPDGNGLADDATRRTEFLARIADNTLAVRAVIDCQAVRIGSRVCYVTGRGDFEIDVSASGATIYYAFESVGGASLFLAGGTFDLLKAPS